MKALHPKMYLIALRCGKRLSAESNEKTTL